MSNKKYRFSNEEDLVIIRNIEQYPDNIKVAIEKATNELNTEPHLSLRDNKERDFKTVYSRYYVNLKRSDNKILFTGSSKGFTHNSKVTFVNKETGEFPEDRTLNKIEWITKLLLNLNKDEREFIFNFFIKANSMNNKK